MQADSQFRFCRLPNSFRWFQPSKKLEPTKRIRMKSRPSLGAIMVVKKFLIIFRKLK